jgi:signal transduction histidine kinase
MTDNSSETSVNFDIHPTVVFRLGDELISDEVQALVELIKNAYDADATFARVNVSTKENLGVGHTYKGARGYISIEDDGFGMTEQVIRDGWLVISNSLKATMKAKAETTTKFGRSPQGDKGLGRLGVQRLGYNLEIFTKPENENYEYHVSFSWHQFMSEKRLSQVPVILKKEPSTRKSGTRIVISDLRNAEIWDAKDSITKLQTSLSRLISPFMQIRNFEINLRVNGVDVDLAEIAEELRTTAQLRYDINYEAQKLTVTGFAKLDYFNPSASDRSAYRELVESDNGKSLLQYLLSKNKGQSYNLQAADADGWYISYSMTLPLTNLDGVAKEQDAPADPGPFYGEIDYFHFEEGAEKQSIFDQVSEYRKYIRDLSGIGVYRDGFGIRVDADWLNLRSEATSGRSRYVLRPDNTIGYITISTLTNPNLRETTSREGFIVNPYYKNFYALLRRFVKFSGDVQNYIRRGWLEFRDAKKATVIERITPDTSPRGISSEMQRTLKQASTVRESLAKTSSELENAMSSNIDFSQTSTGQPLANKVVEQTIQETKKVIQYLDTLSDRVTLPELLANQFQQLQEQLGQTYEMMSLGLTAEALSHEINNIVIQLAERTEQLLRYLKDNNIRDTRLLSYIEYVRTTVQSLRKQLSHFTPSLKYVREKREEIALQPFVDDLLKFYIERFSSKAIQVQTRSSTSHFSIFMNRGKLTQIFDNLLLNSEYWLQENLRLGFISHGIITVNLESPYIYIFDNGRGIDPLVETTLFEPFITTKADNQGRGLGLFIVQQLLDSEGCTIFIPPERNEFGRLYIFALNMTNRLRTNDK